MEGGEEIEMELARCRSLLCAALLLAACAPRAPSIRYQPRERDLVVTAVPLLTHELESTYAFLARDFSPGGVLEGKELYAFVPSSFTVVEGDTVHFTLVNPEDDAHNFVLPGLSLALPGQSVTQGIWRADRAGIFRFTCTIPSHMPEMYGEIVVLPASVGAGFADAQGPERTTALSFQP